MEAPSLGVITRPGARWPTQHQVGDHTGAGHKALTLELPWHESLWAMGLQVGDCSSFIFCNLNLDGIHRTRELREPF